MRRTSKENDIENGQSPAATSPTANGALAERSNDDDGRYCCLVFFAVLMHSSILLLSLVETLFTTLHFDDDKFDFLYVALVFGIFALFDWIVKKFASCTKTPWDDLAVELLSETLKVALYMLFCNFSELSIVWLPIVGGVQIAITIGLFCMKKRHDVSPHSPLDNDQEDPSNSTTESEEDPEDPISMAMFFCLQLLMAVTPIVIPVLYLLTQDQSPFRTQHFEIVLSIYVWMVEASMKLCYQSYQTWKIHFKLFQKWNRFGSDSDDDDDDDDDEARLNPVDEARLNPVDTAATGLAAVALGVTFLAFISFFTYLARLSWKWWLSPEIEDTYDKVVTMLLIVSPLAGCCSCFCLIVFACVSSLDDC